MRWRRDALLGVAVLLLALNAVAWNQAWAMTHYSIGGQRTAKPEALTLSQRLNASPSGG